MAEKGRAANRNRAAAQACLGVALAASVFSATVLVLMAVTVSRLDSADPLHAKTLEKKVQALRQNPADEALREEIRDLDLLARRAFFHSRTFLNTGAVLLLGGVVVFIGALKLRGAVVKRLPVPGPEAEPETPPAWIPSQTALSIAGAAVVLAGFGIALLAPGLVPRTPVPPADTAGLPEAATPKRAPGPEEIVKHWPGFRGPFGLGLAPEASPPLDWDGPSKRNVRWKVELPLPGFSSPAVWGDRLFLTGGDRNTREVFCFDAKGGSLIWRRRVESPANLKPPAVSEDTGFAAPSPAADGRVVCALFATGDLVCMDAEGKILWNRNLGVPRNPYGHGSSPLIMGDLIVVQYDHGGGADLSAYRLADGSLAWKTARDAIVSWSSPILVDTGGMPTLVLNGNPFAAAYEASSGRELWKVECMMGEVASSPAFLDGVVFVANENALCAAIDSKTREILWEADLDLPDVSSPLACSGRLFVPSGGGIVTCYDARTGKELWLQEFKEGFWSSPVLAAGRIYLLDRKGVMRIFADRAEYEELGAPALGESSMCTSAFVGRRIYIRGSRHLFCIGGQDD